MSTNEEGQRVESPPHDAILTLERVTSQCPGAPRKNRGNRTNRSLDDPDPTAMDGQGEVHGDDGVDDIVLSRSIRRYTHAGMGLDLDGDKNNINNNKDNDDDSDDDAGNMYHHHYQHDTEGDVDVLHGLCHERPDELDPPPRLPDRSSDERSGGLLRLELSAQQQSPERSQSGRTNPIHNDYANRRESAEGPSTPTQFAGSYDDKERTTEIKDSGAGGNQTRTPPTVRNLFDSMALRESPDRSPGAARVQPKNPSNRGGF